ncbi:hypothetical protein J6U78_03745 [bacterium]|nr:hypothetical protein [bacterium]
MTEYEFRNLNIGDEIWVVKDYSESLVVKGSVSEISIDGFAYRSVYIKGDPSSHKYCNVFKTEVEAYQNCLDKNEWFLKQANHNLEELTIKRDKSRVALVRAKKRAEETKWKWIVKYSNGIVFEGMKINWQIYDTNNFSIHDTKQEAYEALAKFYERKLFKALEKCGYKFGIPCDKWIVPMLVRAEKEDFWRVNYYPSQSYGCVRKQDLFDTLEEAEAELKRRNA